MTKLDLSCNWLVGSTNEKSQYGISLKKIEGNKHHVIILLDAEKIFFTKFNAFFWLKKKVDDFNIMKVTYGKSQSY